MYVCYVCQHSLHAYDFGAIINTYLVTKSSSSHNFYVTEHIRHLLGYAIIYYKFILQ